MIAAKQGLKILPTARLCFGLQAPTARTLHHLRQQQPVSLL
jgi:hypothetical protein